jgi:hypothetical protein
MSAPRRVLQQALTLTGHMVENAGNYETMESPLFDAAALRNSCRGRLRFTYEWVGPCSVAGNVGDRSCGVVGGLAITAAP